MLDFEARNIALGVRADNREQAIGKVAALLEQNGFVEKGYATSMLQREELSSTYLGSGIAIPHGLPSDRERISRTGVAIVQLPEGVAWAPGSVAHLVVGIAARSDEHLELLASLTGLLDQEELLARLAHTSDAEELVAAFSGKLEASPSAPSALPALSAHALSVEALVGPKHGLHARPATAFAALARSFTAKVQVEFEGRHADGRSMASLLQLGAAHGARVTILVDGPDAVGALAELKQQIEAEEVESAPVKKAAAHGWKPKQSTRSAKGVSISPGLAIGRIHRFGAVQIETAAPTDNPREEKRQLDEAIKAALAELAELAADVQQRGAKDAAAIFAAHAEILQDPALLKRVDRGIDTLPSASYIWKQETDRMAEQLSHSESEITAGRAADVRDAAARVLRCLLKQEKQRHSEEDDEPQILIADALTPSDAATLDRARVAGFCTVEGSATSHVAILARSLNIPAITGIRLSEEDAAEGDLVILDADGGSIYLEPADEDLLTARHTQQLMADRQAMIHEQRYQPAITQDGLRIEVCANIGKVAEVAQAVEAGGEGSGLLRSEFLFLDREDAPTEEEQYTTYRAMLEGLAGLPLVLRTLDIGGDKPVPYIKQEREENPFLGVRGIRLCLRNEALFRTQLRAAYRASRHGSLKIMFPMIASPDEMRAARRIAEEVRTEVRAVPVEIGTMIEVPAAVLMADELAEVADFFSIGTNDLTQYVLAMDRGNAQLAEQAHGLHPAVLRMIARTVEAANRHGRWTGVCGGLAGEAAGAVLLAGLGVRELSVAVPAIPTIKHALRQTTRTQAEALAKKALACPDLASVRALLAAEGEF